MSYTGKKQKHCPKPIIFINNRYHPEFGCHTAKADHHDYGK